MRILAAAPRNVRQDVLFLAILLLISGVLHSIYQFGSLYGEHDAARFVVDGVIWAKTGVRSVALSEYRFYVSPAFIYLAKLAYGLSQATGIHPEIFLDVLTNIFAVLFFVPAYLFFANLLGAPGAFVACLYLEIIPAFWFSGLYGFPTMIALFFLLLALWLWDEFLLERVMPERRWFSLVLVFLAALAAMLLKADILVLSAPAFVGVALLRRGLGWRTLTTAIIVISAAAATGYGIGHSLIQDSAQASQYAAQWNQQFDAGKAAAIGVKETGLVDWLRLYAMSMGLMTIPAVLAALGMMLFEKQWWFAIAVAIWLPTSFLFWAWRPGDIGRHHISATVPAALAIGYLFASAARSRYRYAIYGFLCLVPLVDTFRYPPSATLGSPSGRLFASARLIRNEAARIQGLADAYVTGNCNAVLLGSPFTPYAEAALLVRVQHFTITPEKVDGYLVRKIDYDRDVSHCESLNVRVLSATAAAKAAAVFRGEGRSVRSYEYALGD